MPEFNHEMIIERIIQESFSRHETVTNAIKTGNSKGINLDLMNSARRDAAIIVQALMYVDVHVKYVDGGRGKKEIEKPKD